MIRSTLMFAVLALSTGCVESSEAGRVSDDLAAIAQIRDEHVEAVNTFDADLLLRGMAEDVVYLGPDLAPIVGKPALDAFVRPIYAAMGPDGWHISMAAEDVRIDGNWAFEWGNIDGTARGADGAMAPFLAKYLFVYRREPDGAWRIVYDAYNANPATP
jgi:uncharacterized protein (TIGR02246 family)